MDDVMALTIAQTTCGSASEANALAEALVREHLAVCVNIGPPSRSVYPWDGAIEVAEEVVLTIKTAAHKTEALKAFIEAHHDYDVPELLLFKIDDGLPAYLDWARGWLDQDESKTGIDIDHA